MTDNDLNEQVNVTVDDASVITVPIDATLSNSNEAADAKAVGDRLALKADKSELQAAVKVNNQPADAQGLILIDGRHIPVSDQDTETLANAVTDLKGKTAADIPMSSDSDAKTIAEVVNANSEAIEGMEEMTGATMPIESGSQTTVKAAIEARAKTVNRKAPDADGDIDLSVVPLAENLQSDKMESVEGAFIIRTTGGNASVSDGKAYPLHLFGAAEHTGYVAEELNMTVIPIARTEPDEPITATIDRDTFVAYVDESSTINLYYTTEWSADPELYGITVTGTPEAGDQITVVYVKEVRGTITVANPARLVGTGWNLFDYNSGYARVVKYSTEYGYKVGGSYASLQFSATLTGERSSITPGVDGLFNVPSDGYVFVSGGNNTDTYILCTWSDWMEGPSSGYWEPYRESGIDLSAVMTTYFPNGLLAVGTTRDEIDLSAKRSISRIERMAYSEENRAAAAATGRSYDFDQNYIYIVRESAVISAITIDTTYNVSEHGLEWFTETTLPVITEILYGKNLRDKLERDVVTISAQTLTEEEKAQVRTNIGAMSQADGDKKLVAPTSAGTNGQLLQTNGDGTTKWTTQGTPTDAQVGTAVSAWLTAHPEATTTVQDGAISRAKLNDDLKEKTDAVPELKSAFDNIIDTVIFTEKPCVDLSGYIYYQPENKLTTSANCVVRRYVIQPDTDYYATTSWDTNNTSIYLVSYFSITNEYISSEYQNTANGSRIDKAKLNIPSNARWFYINGRNVTPFVESAKIADAVDDIIQNFIFEVEPIVKTDGYAYYQPSNSITSASNFKVYKYTIQQNADYYITSALTAASEGFPLIAYFDASNNFISSEYMNSTTGTTEIENSKAIIPSGAAWFYVNARNTTPYVGIYKKGMLESVSTTVEKHEEMLTKVNIQPMAVIPGYGYVNTDHAIHTVANGTVKKIKVDSDTSYYVTTSFIGADAVFPLIAYFDSSDDFISYEYMNQPNVETAIKDQLLNIPSGASWFYVNSRPGDSIIYTIEDPEVSLAEFEKKIGTKNSHEVSILFIGNSLTQDGIAYLPYLLKNYYPDIKFKFYIWYNGGYTLAQQYTKFTNNEYCEIFSIAEDTATWTNMVLRMSDVLSMYQFDIVCLQEYFNYKTSYTDTDLTDWNNCRNYITSNYTGGNGLEFVTLFHAPKRDDAQSIFNLAVAGNCLELQKTIADDMIPNGIAVYRALSTDLDNLGDQGHLSPDGTHTQEGLPCLLQTYVTACWLFDRFGIARSVYGCPMRMTTAIYNSINVPGPNLGTGVITGTDAQNLLAQEVAIQAYKEGKYYVENNIFLPSN